MNQEKIGRFIAECRKKENLTQMQLAEKLNITDRAVSKWENGRAMPDTTIMLELCAILKINVNDLLSGEVVTMENYNSELEKNLMEAIRQKEEGDKRLLRLEIVIGSISIITLLALLGIAVFIPMMDYMRFIIIGIGFALFLAGCFAALRIEQVAGYYECRICGHRYVPTYKQVNMAPHMGRKRKMKCPECGKKSWQIKVITKE